MVYVYKNEKKWIKNENCEHPYCHIEKLVVMIE